MPKQTFFNLPEDKRQKFIDVCIDEFALFDYKTASISKIVLKAGIAKGSVYQYFENKKDLYFYLIDFISGIKLDYLNHHLNFSVEDFFALYKQIIFVSAKFDLIHPRYSRLMYNVGRESYNDEIGDVSKKLLESSSAYLKTLIADAQRKGQIRTDVAADMMAFVISYLSVDIGEYITRKFNFSYYDVLRRGDTELPITDEQLGSVLDDLIKLLKTGLIV